MFHPYGIIKISDALVNRSKVPNGTENDLYDFKRRLSC